MALTDKEVEVPKNVWRELARLEDIIRNQGQSVQASLKTLAERISSLEENVADHERRIGDALGDDIPRGPSYGR